MPSHMLSHSLCLSISLSVSVCLSVCLSLCVCLCACVCVSLSVCLSLCVCLCACVCLSLSVCLFAQSGKAHGDVTEQFKRQTTICVQKPFPTLTKRQVCVCVCVCVCVWMCVCVCVTHMEHICCYVKKMIFWRERGREREKRGGEMRGGRWRERERELRLIMIMMMYCACVVLQQSNQGFYSYSLIEGQENSKMSFTIHIIMQKKGK